MSRVFVKNGKPVEGRSICETCNNAHILRGYRDTEVLVYCIFNYDQTIPVPFEVRECTKHDDKNRPTWDQMEELAIPIRAAKTMKAAGLHLPEPEKREVASETETACE